jgi:uncharacterized membrane protein YvbJ
VLIVCNKCGNKISDKASKCPKCGNLISSANYSDFNEIKSSNSKQMPIWKKLLIGIIVVIIFFWVLGKLPYILAPNNIVSILR